MQYWKLSTEANHYWPIGKGFVLYLDGQVGYGKTYGSNGISDDDFDALKAATAGSTEPRPCRTCVSLPVLGELLLRRCA